MQNHAKHLQGESDRVRILQYMIGKAVTTVELRDELGLTKYQTDHHVRYLLVHKYIQRKQISGSRFLYSRTRQTYTPKTIAGTAVKKEKSNLMPEDLIEIKPISPHARVIRLLSNPLPPPPKPKRSSGYLYSGIQSGLGMFNMEA
jgi:hypothetical protein